MRAPNDRGLGVRAGIFALAVIVPVLFVACGTEAPSSAAPTVRPTPTATADPHLADPATADEVYHALAASGLRIAAVNANGGDAPLVKQINATYAGWPLAVAQYSSTAALTKLLGWKDGQKPGRGEAPVAIAGSNILVTWGPRTGAKPPRPDPRQLDALEALTAAMDRLLWPLQTRSVIPLTVTVPASPSATTGPGSATPAP
jgi:hypothetical protein